MWLRDAFYDIQDRQCNNHASFLNEENIHSARNFFQRNYPFLCPLGNFKIHKRSTLTKIHPIQNLYLELSWESTVIYPTVERTAYDTVC